LLEDAAFWPNCQRGLAVWLSPTLQLIFKSHVAFRESLTIGQRFRIRSLVRCFDQEAAGFVLAVSQDQVGLYSVTGTRCERISVPGLPANLRDALNETSVDRGAQSHSVGKSVKKKQTTVFHAQGAGHETEKQDLGEYCRKIAEVIDDYLDLKRVPLVLACVETLAPIYRQASTYPYLLPEIIAGSPDRLTAQQIVELALPRLQSDSFQEVASQLARFRDLQAADRASTDTAQIVREAIDGHVEELFFDDGRDVWGRYEEVDEVVDVYDSTVPLGDELIELAVDATLRHRGRVHAVADDQLPSPMPMAAILRHVPASIQTVSPVG
jgi:hypothetical protein